VESTMKKKKKIYIYEDSEVNPFVLVAMVACKFLQ